MKKLILLGLIVGLFNSCTECPADRFTTSSPEIDSAKQLVVDYNKGDWDAWASHYAADAKVYHNTTTGSSPTEVLAGLKEILAQCSSYGWSDENVFYEMIIDDNGEKWVYYWATWLGELAGNGQKLEVPVHLAQKYEDGKIAEEYGYYDVTEFTLAVMSLAQAAETGAAVEE